MESLSFLDMFSFVDRFGFVDRFCFMDRFPGESTYKLRGGGVGSVMKYQYWKILMKCQR